MCLGFIWPPLQDIPVQVPVHGLPSLDTQDGGSLVMFRSDMPHEVLPTFGQRFALSMWCHAD